MALRKLGTATAAAGTAVAQATQQFIKILRLDTFVRGGGIPAGDY